MKQENNEFLKVRDLEEFLSHKVADLKLDKVTYKSFELRDNHIVITILGGFNGACKWDEYLDQIKVIMKSFDKSWLVKLENDCADDLWHLEIGWWATNIVEFYTEKLNSLFDTIDKEKSLTIKVAENSYITVPEMGTPLYLYEDYIEKKYSGFPVGSIFNTKLLFYDCEAFNIKDESSKRSVIMTINFGELSNKVITDFINNGLKPLNIEL